jgi:hypothetical protein
VVKVILFNLWELFMKLTQLFGFIAIILFSVFACATENQHQNRTGPPQFSQLDLDQSGAVSLEEFKQHEIPHGDHDTAFNHIDANGDGVLTENEVSSHKPAKRR